MVCVCPGCIGAYSQYFSSFLCCCGADEDISMLLCKNVPLPGLVSVQLKVACISISRSVISSAFVPNVTIF